MIHRGSGWVVSVNGPSGTPLGSEDLIDFDLCWAFDLADPWGNQYELNCYDYDRIVTDLVDADGLRPVRYWPADLHERHRSSGSGDG
ncbi:MAG: hypothetical protein RIB98_12135 [Acidimicrobiales bacterium]